MLTIRYQPNLHPAVISALQQLKAEFEAQGLPTSPLSPLEARPNLAGPDQVLVGREDWAVVQAGATHKQAEDVRVPGADGHLWQVGQDDSGSRWATIIGADDRGAMIGVYDLIERVQLARGWPALGQGSSVPYFAVRRWSIAISRLQGRPWDDRRTLCDGLVRVQRIAGLAPR